MLGCDPSYCTLCAQNRLLVQVQGVLRRSALGAQQRSARCATHPSPCPCPCPCHWRGLWTRRSLDFGLVRLGTRTRLCELGEWVIGRFVCCHSFVRRPGPGKFWGCGTGTGTAALHCRDLFFFFFFWRACEIWRAATNLQCFVCNLYPGRYGTQLCFKN